MRRILSAIVVASALMVAVPGTAHARSPVAHTITYDRYSMMIDGQRVWLWSAEFHYFLKTVTTGTAGGDQNSTAQLDLPPGAVQPGRDNVVSVLVRNMGHNEDGGSNDNQKRPRGLLSAALVGSATPIAWRIQGGTPDPVRGPQNNGGLHGERAGYPLPGFPDGDWARVSLPHPETTPGIAWYRTTADLNLPNDQDVPVGLRFTDDPAHRSRVLIFVNGWNVGQYVGGLGPQQVFTLPPGILRPRGRNTIALAVWSDDGTTGGLGRVTLEPLGNHTTAARIGDMPSPGR